MYTERCWPPVQPIAMVEIAAVGLGELGDAALEELGESRDHRAHARVAGEVLDHRRVAAGQMAQRLLPVRIRQTADVEDEIRVAGDAVFVAE